MKGAIHTRTTGSFVAVYTQLDDEMLAQMLSIYPKCGIFIRAEGVAAGSINSIFRVYTSLGIFYVRISEGQSLQQLVKEQQLLDFLHRHQHRLGKINTPHMLRNVAQGSFYPLEKKTTSKPQWAAVFPELRGRELAVFELAPDHLAQLGKHLAKTHLLLRHANLRQKNPFGVHKLAIWMQTLSQELKDRTLLQKLQRALQHVLYERRKRLLPRGIIHGDLFLNNTKWQNQKLSAVFDWEMAGTDALLLDVAIIICAWCWVRPQNINAAKKANQGYFRTELIKSFLYSYQEVRPLSAQEKRSFLNEMKLAALRFCISRVHDFELPTRSTAPRDFLDYQEYWSRYQYLQKMKPADIQSQWL